MIFIWRIKKKIKERIVIRLLRVLFLEDAWKPLLSTTHREHSYTFFSRLFLPGFNPFFARFERLASTRRKASSGSVFDLANLVHPDPRTDTPTPTPTLPQRLSTTTPTRPVFRPPFPSPVSPKRIDFSVGQPTPLQRISYILTNPGRGRTLMLPSVLISFNTYIIHNTIKRQKSFFLSFLLFLFLNKFNFNVTFLDR